MTTQKMTFDAAPSVLAGGTSVARTLLPLLVVVLVAFVVIGVAMPVLPLHVHDGLGFGPVIVGLVAGSQFVAALMARIWAGRTADLHGAKHAVIAGLVGATAAGLLYLVSLGFTDAPPIRFPFCWPVAPCSARRRVSSLPEPPLGGFPVPAHRTPVR